MTTSDDLELTILEIDEMRLQWVAADSLASIIEQSMKTEFRTWCDENCDKPVDFKAVVVNSDLEGSVIHRFVIFHQATDAILFKLTWGGKYASSFDDG